MICRDRKQREEGSFSATQVCDLKSDVEVSGRCGTMARCSLTDLIPCALSCSKIKVLRASQSGGKNRGEESPPSSESSIALVPRRCPFRSRSLSSSSESDSVMRALRKKWGLSDDLSASVGESATRGGENRVPSSSLPSMRNVAASCSSRGCTLISGFCWTRETRERAEEGSGRGNKERKGKINDGIPASSICRFSFARAVELSTRWGVLVGSPNVVREGERGGKC